VRIGVLHPDLGIGGAERLVVDAALELRSAGHEVVLFTAHHDRTGCFEETRDGTLDVRVYGSVLPAHIGGRLRAPCAVVRMLYLAAAVSWRGGRFDVLFCDLISYAIPVLKLLARVPVVFYCHFPDQLLAPRRGGLYRWYRAPIDWLEETTTGMADRVLVNSRFTASVFRETFPRLRSVTPAVVYPGVDCEQTRLVNAAASGAAPPDDPWTVLCVGRYHPSKNLALAVESLAELRARVAPEVFERVRLVVAGGYDERLAECRDTYAALEALSRRLGLEARVVLLRSPGDAERMALLARCRCVLHPTEHEHFGYAPIEAMAAGRPVIAAASGGPVETIRDGETGFLCPATGAGFAAALRRLLLEPSLAERMGRAARDRAIANFSRRAFGRRLEAVLQEAVHAGRGATVRAAG
jgi:alpha-1,3/alpha-1,6-mannosyltransferase